MGKPKPPSEGDKRTADRWSKDKHGFDHYCPTCRVWYSASSIAHRGH